MLVVRTTEREVPQNRKAIDIKGFGGIDTRHIRKLGQFSDGKNFWTRSGALFTREGCSLITGTPFTAPIRSIHSAGKAGLTTRLLVEEGVNLWHRLTVGGAWVNIKNNVAGNTYDSTIWATPFGDSYLLLVSGAQMLIYDIAAGTITAMQNLDGGTVPPMEFVTTFKGYVFGWAPNYSYANLVRFCGLDNNERQSIDYWPEDHALDVSGNASEPVIDVIPFQTHLFVLTTKGYYMVYGSGPTNFETSPGGRVGAYGLRCSAMAGDLAIWLGLDNGVRRVYAYSGTSAFPISQPIDELLQLADFTNVRAHGFGNQFWLLTPAASKTTAYAFDVMEKAWFIHEFPFRVAAGCGFGSYLAREYLHLGLHDNRLIMLDDSTTDLGAAITTTFDIGPVNIDNRTFNVKTFYVNAEPRNDFDIDVYAQVDSKALAGPYTAGFETGEVVTRSVKPRAKGQNITLRVTTTDKINEIQSATLTVIPRAVK